MIGSMGFARNFDLRINVAQLLKGPTGAVRRMDLCEDITRIDAELSIQSPLAGSLTLIRTADGVLVTASLDATKSSIPVPTYRRAPDCLCSTRTRTLRPSTNNTSSISLRLCGKPSF